MNWHSLWRSITRRSRHSSIDPDEVLLDATNLPQFNESQFEGRIEQPLSKKTFLTFIVVILLITFFFGGRAFTLQVIRGSEYAQQSENNRLERHLLFADRGIIYDRTGQELVWNSLYEGESFAKRVYTDTQGVSHLLGYLGYPLRDNNGNYYQDHFIGKSGVESEFDHILAGENGLKIIEIDALNKLHSEGVIQSPQNGDDIHLSVDARISSKLYQLLKERATESGFTAGSGVIMNVNTGEVLALSNFPEYDSSLLTNGENDDISKLFTDERKPFLNRAVSGLYTPGSIIKPFIAIAALEEGVISPEKEIVSTGSLSIPNPYFPEQVNVFRDWKAHGAVDLRRALAVSSNVYFYEIAGGFGDQEGVGIENIGRYVRLFGFGEETGIELGNESIGTIPSPAWKEETFEDGLWRLGDTYHTAIGQYGFQVTIIQAVRAISALANNGTLVTPTVLSENNSRKIKKEVLPIKKENMQVVREGMRLAVTEGTASGLYIPQLEIAAKTGTAELGISKKFVNSWAVGFFPYDEPQYAFAILMERGPKENLIGALYVARQLFEWMDTNTPEYLTSK